MEEKTCCVTGHRSIPSDQTEAVRQGLEQAVRQAVKDEYTVFISGFADGLDLMFAEIVSQAMQENPKIKLIAALTYRRRLETLQKRERTKALIEQCAEIYVAAEEYQPSVYVKRNRYMVERSDRVIAVYDGRDSGGTVGTIRLAHQMKKELREIPVGPLHIPEHLKKKEL